MSEFAIRTKGLSKQYRIGARQESYSTIRESLTRVIGKPLRGLAGIAGRTTGDPTPSMWALDDVSIDIGRGEVVGIIGRNGAGKSTLLKILARITDPTSGYADVWGRVGSLLEVGTGFHQELTGRENIHLNGAILGMPRNEIRRKFDSIVDFAELDRFIDTPVKRYSSGMYMRLAFAVAAHLEPDVLMVDEVLAVGDVAFQKKCLGKMEDVARNGRTVVFVSHNMAVIRSLCTKGILLEEGRVGHVGPIEDSIRAYLHSVGTSGEAQLASAATRKSRSTFGPISVNGGTGSTINQADPLTVSTTLNVSDDACGFNLYFILEDMHGARIVYLVEDSKSLGFEQSSSGEHGIRISLPPMWLNPGIYSFHFMVRFWGGYRNSRQLSDNIPLDVNGAGAQARCALSCGTMEMRADEGDRVPSRSLLMVHDERSMAMSQIIDREASRAGMLQASVLGMRYHRLLAESVDADLTAELKSTFHYSFVLSYGRFDDPDYSTVDKQCAVIDLTGGYECAFARFNSSMRRESRLANSDERLALHFVHADFAALYQFHVECEHERDWFPVPEEELRNSLVVSMTYDRQPISAVSCYRTGRRLRVGRIFSKRRSATNEGIPKRVTASAAKRIIASLCEYGVEHGCDTFDLGGVDLDDPTKQGITKFKRCFGVEIVPVTIGRFETSEFAARKHLIREAGLDVT